MRDAIKHFTDLEVWQKSRELAVITYSATAKFPKSELFGITNQIRRAVTSISANIAEGMGRGSYADRARFYYNTRGSIYEVESYLIVSKDLKHLAIDEFTKSMDILNSTRMLLNAFIAKTLKIADERQ
jgi:four helix bundle protein